MKKLFAFVLCLMLTAGALAETVPGARLTAENITVTVGGETFSPDLTVNFDGISREDGAFAGFFLTMGEKKLLPVQAQLDASGVSLKLGGSQVYCFTPNWFAGLSGYDDASEVFALLLAPGAIDVRQLGFGFEEFLSAQPEDSFTLEQAQLLSWLEGAAGMQEGTLSALVEGPVLPALNVSRTEIGYSIGWDDSGKTLLAEREAEGLVYTLSGEEDILGVRYMNDGGIQASYTYHTKSDYGYENAVMWSYELAQNESGAEYSMLMQVDNIYDEPDYWADNSVTEFSMDGTVDADGVNRAHVILANTCEIGPDLAAEFDVVLAPAQVEDNIAGQKVTTVNDYTDDSLSYLAFAAMGLMGDVEKLMSDSEIAGVMETYSVLNDAAYEEWEKRQEEENPGPTVADLPFEVPEFTYIPEGYEFEEEQVIGDYYSRDYASESGQSLHINMEVSDLVHYMYTEDGELAEAEDPVVSFRDVESGYRTLTVYENGIETSVYTYDNPEITREDMLAVLNGRVWGE